VDGKKIGVIEVPSGINKPYVLSGAIYLTFRTLRVKNHKSVSNVVAEY
jgi:hypothetical protein